MVFIDYSTADVLTILSRVKVEPSDRVESETIEFKQFVSESALHNSKELAEERILSREDHFYKGSGGSTHEESDPTTTQTVESGDTDDKDNSEWEFKPVDFPHVVLDGNDEVTTNAQKIVDVIQIQLLNRK